MTEKQIARGPDARDIEVDVLVMGAGTGKAAALAAHERGLSVLVVEKTPLVGGSCARSGGAFWIPGNPVLEREGADTSRTAAEAYLDAIVAGQSPRERYLAYLDHGPAAVAMLERLTRLKFVWTRGYSDYHAEQPGGSAEGRTCESAPFDLNLLGPERHRFRPGAATPPVPLPATGADYKWLALMRSKPLKALPVAGRRAVQGLGGLLLGRHYVALGEALAAGLFDACLRNNIPVWTRTAVTALTEENGRVVGATIEQDGRQHQVRARRGVILAAGGFDHNMAMRGEYQRRDANVSLGSEGNTGDAIRLGQQLGAELRLMEEAWWFPAVPNPQGGYPKILLAERSLPGSLIVDADGQRFLDESIDYMSFGQTVLRREREGGCVGQMWLLFDQLYRDSYLFATEVIPGGPLPASWYEAGIAHKADSVEALARAAKLPPEALAATLARYNAMAASGKDTDFGRGDTAYGRYYGDPAVTPNPNLRPLEGTLYAVKLVLSDLGTCGGLAADERARVLRPDGTAIPGLFAIGNTAANAFGRVYPGAGGTIGQGITFGFIAAQALADAAS